MEEIILRERILSDILGIEHQVYDLKTWTLCQDFDYGSVRDFLLGGIGGRKYS